MIVCLLGFSVVEGFGGLIGLRFKVCLWFPGMVNIRSTGPWHWDSGQFGFEGLR